MIIASPPKISLDLNASDATNIHRSGMAGLWMSLKQLEKKYPKSNHRPGNLTWNLTTTTVTLNWHGQDVEVIDWLLQQCFQINEHGLIQFVGLESLNPINQIHKHQAIHDTFLRHNKFYKKEKAHAETLTLEAGDIKLNYRGLKWYAHQKFAETLCDEGGYLIDGYIPIVSWLYPGATVRHARLQAITKIEEKTEYAFALLFLPLVCEYFTLLSNFSKRDKKAASYAIVIPDVSNFETAADRCWQSGDRQYQDCFVSNLEEAALKCYSYSETEISCPQNCQVLLFAKLNKQSRQRTILEIENFNITAQAVTDYQFILENFIGNKIFVYDKGFFVIKLNSIRAIIANNIARKLPWLWNLWESIYQTEPLEAEDLEKQLVYNRRGLIAMLEQDPNLNNYFEFINAFHKALRTIYARTYDKKRSKAENNQRIDKKYQAIRSEINQCYDQESLEDFLADFLSRGGLNPSLYNSTEEILALILGESEWRKLRNISLLALASYKPRSFSLKDIPLKFWRTLLGINYQTAVLFLLQKPLLEIFPEAQEETDASSAVNTQ